MSPGVLIALFLSTVPANEAAAATVEARESDPSSAADPLRHAKWAALIDGGWSILITAAWGLSARTWDAPYPNGFAGLATARILYGTSWSILLTTEVGLLRLIVGDEWEGLSRARVRNTWWTGLTIPANCAGVRSATCGLGLGGYTELTVRVHDGVVPLEVLIAGGWIQGHHSTDSNRTLMESTWIQSPFIGRAHFGASLGASRLELALGGGIYYGMHNAHVHPRRPEDDPKSDHSGTEGLGVPFHEIVPLHYGVGTGLHARVWLSFLDTFTLEAGLDLAPFLFFGAARDLPASVAALEPITKRTAPLVFRQVSLGLALDQRFLYPVTVGAHAFALELSTRPVDQFGHRGFMLTFEVPFELGEKLDETRRESSTRGDEMMINEDAEPVSSEHEREETTDRRKRRPDEHARE